MGRTRGVVVAALAVRLSVARSRHALVRELCAVYDREMTHENLVALDIADPSLYQQYRDAMRPLLEAAGGGFRYDFEISRTLRAEATHPIQRVFAIYFRDRAAKEAFFADPAYLAIRARFFAPAVRAVTVIAEYDR
jgi:uncharacterized protein (DUF1330 family)